jgi:hypothetical protein
MDAPSKKQQALEFLEKQEAALQNYILEGEDRDALIRVIDQEWQGNLPFTVLLRPGGEAVFSHDGIIDPLEVRKAVIGELGRYYADDTN